MAPIHTSITYSNYYKCNRVFVNYDIYYSSHADLCRMAGSDWMGDTENRVKWREVGKAFVLQWSTLGSR